MPSAQHYQWGPAPYITDLLGFLRGDLSSQANQVTWEKYPPPFFFLFFFFFFTHLSTLDWPPRPMTFQGPRDQGLHCRLEVGQPYHLHRRLSWRAALCAWSRNGVNTVACVNISSLVQCLRLSHHRGQCCRQIELPGRNKAQLETMTNRCCHIQNAD